MAILLSFVRISHPSQFVPIWKILARVRNGLLQVEEPESRMLNASGTILGWAYFAAFQEFGPAFRITGLPGQQDCSAGKSEHGNPSSHTCHAREKEDEGKAKPVTPELHEDLWVLWVANPASGSGGAPVS